MSCSKRPMLDTPYAKRNAAFRGRARLCTWALVAGLAWAPSLGLAQESPEAAVEVEATEAAAPAAVPAPAASLAQIFLSLSGDALSGVGGLAYDLTSASVSWGIGLGLLAALAGFLLWRELRRREALNWKGKRIGWLVAVWCVALTVLPGAGGAYSGMWYGGGRCLKHYVDERRVLDQAVARLYCAIVLDQAHYTPTGEESLEQFDKILADSKELQHIAREDFDDGVATLAGVEPDGLLMSWALRALSALVGDQLGQAVAGADPRAAFSFLMKTPNVEAYLKEHPEASPWMATFAEALQSLRKQAVRTIDGWVYPNMVVGWALGLGLPLLALVLYRWGAKAKPEPTPPSTPAAASVKS
ncbi:MAG: hypothetical protein HS116_14520 [Planctomycetes bacterium]|nr:hypothetical protein [Planctomycetota bacterium]